MVKYGLLAAAIILTGCSTMNESRLVADETHLVRQNADLLNCRVGSTPVCKMSGAQGREMIKSCECTQIPYYLSGGRTFGTQRRRH